MSNLDRQPALSTCGGRGFVVAEPVRELLSPRTVKLGQSTEVRRLLPNLGRRMVGAWCFVDHYGPDDIADEPGMQVAPHPHSGLQTVSWLHDGEVHSCGVARTSRVSASHRRHLEEAAAAALKAREAARHVRRPRREAARLVKTSGTGRCRRREIGHGRESCGNATRENYFAYFLTGVG